MIDISWLRDAAYSILFLWGLLAVSFAFCVVYLVADYLKGE